MRRPYARCSEEKRTIGIYKPIGFIKPIGIKKLISIFITLKTNMSLEESIEARILKKLYMLESEGDMEKAYKREIARSLGISEKAAYTYLRSLLRKGYIKVSRQEGVQRFYSLTEKGRALAWALKNPDELAALSRGEETVKLGGRLIAHPQMRIIRQTEEISKGLDILLKDSFALQVLDEEDLQKLKEAKRILNGKFLKSKT
jgi:DNA-binding MarR family transcriptional regulator